MSESPITPQKMKAQMLQMQNDLYAEIRRTSIAFILLIFLSLIVCLFLPELREKAVGQITELFMQKELVSPEGNVSFLGLFVNNASACLMAMLWGLIPYVSLPALALGTNAILLGIMAAHAIHMHKTLFFLVGILPHGIFEFPAMILAFALGLYVCGQMTRRCKKDKSAYSFLQNLVFISCTFVLLLIPLLIIAAALEAWVTPLLLQLFFSF